VVSKHVDIEFTRQSQVTFEKEKVPIVDPYGIPKVTSLSFDFKPSTIILCYGLVSFAKAEQTNSVSIQFAQYDCVIDSIESFSIDRSEELSKPSFLHPNIA